MYNVIFDILTFLFAGIGIRPVSFFFAYNPVQVFPTFLKGRELLLVAATNPSY